MSRICCRLSTRPSTETCGVWRGVYNHAQCALIACRVLMAMCDLIAASKPHVIVHFPVFECGWWLPPLRRVVSSPLRRRAAATAPPLARGRVYQCGISWLMMAPTCSGAGRAQQLCLPLPLGKNSGRSTICNGSSIQSQTAFWPAGSHKSLLGELRVRAGAVRGPRTLLVPPRRRAHRTHRLTRFV